MPRGRKPQARLPFEPISRLYPDQSLRSLADMFGVTWTAISAWEQRGVPINRADDIAVTRLGLHPASLWGAAWWESTPLED